MDSKELKETLTDINDQVRKKSKSRVLRFVIVFCVPFVLAIVCLLLVTTHLYYSALLIWFFVPISYLFLYGTVKSRLLNALPLMVLLLYIMISLETKDAEKASLIFFVVPILSVLMKPKKHWIQYLVLLISVIYLVVNQFTALSFPFAVKWALIGIVYMVFFPPMLLERLKGMFRRNKKPKKSE